MSSDNTSLPEPHVAMVFATETGFNTVDDIGVPATEPGPDTPIATVIQWAAVEQAWEGVLAGMVPTVSLFIGSFDSPRIQHITVAPDVAPDAAITSLQTDELMWNELHGSDWIVACHDAWLRVITEDSTDTDITADALTTDIPYIVATCVQRSEPTTMLLRRYTITDDGSPTAATNQLITITPGSKLFGPMQAAMEHLIVAARADLN